MSSLRDQFTGSLAVFVYCNLTLSFFAGYCFGFFVFILSSLCWFWFLGFMVFIMGFETRVFDELVLIMLVFVYDLRQRVCMSFGSVYA